MKNLFLTILIVTFLGNLGFSQKKSKMAAAAPMVMPDLDLNTPEGAIKANRKIQQSLKDGENCWYVWEGNVFSRVPGEKDRLLFTYIAMNVRSSKTVMDSIKGYGYRHVSKEILLYLDPVTKQPLKTWKNPFTGKDVEVLHIANDPVNAPPMFAKTPGREYKFSGRVQDGMLFSLTEVPLFYSNPLAGEYQDQVGGTYQAMEIFDFAVPVKEVIRGDKDKADDVVVAWTRVSKWLPWMEMGDKTGQMIFSGLGKKMDSFDKMPEMLKNEIKTNPTFAGYETAPPVDDTRPNETSWTYYKKWAEKKKKAAGK
jgi:hypothetical protein